MKDEKQWKIHTICKTCIFRQTAGWSVNVATDWSNTCCTYTLITDKFIDREKITDRFCPAYIRDDRKPKKYIKQIKRSDIINERN